MRRLLKTCFVCFVALLGAGTASTQVVPPQIQIDDERRMKEAVASLKAQRPGVVDGYVIVAALDSDPVFGREAREAGRVLASRFDAQGRTLVFAADEGSDTANGAATPERLARALGSVAALMNRDEDVLILYTTSHGSPRAGLNFRDPAHGAAIISPARLAAMLDKGRFKNRLIILQACFSGQFVPVLSGPRTVVATAASAMKPSFGCTAANDWTFFGHALINQAMRRPDTFARQFRRAYVTILGWEQRLGFESSSPQISIGGDASGWLAALDARGPKATVAPVGRPPSELAH